MHLSSSYGVQVQDDCDDLVGYHCENIKRQGFTVLDNAVSKEFLSEVEQKFTKTLSAYKNKFGIEYLKSIDEYNGFRMPFYFDKFFLNIAMNELVLKIVSTLMGGNFVLNQQNAISNPGNENYNQAKWHRDLPYSHYTSSRPLMINALFCIDDFKITNGSTRVIPGSHLFENFPSEMFITENAITAETNAGSFIILDSMLYHSGTHNSTDKPRRAINNVYSTPHFKQQINVSAENTKHLKLTPNEERLLGVSYKNFDSIEEYFDSRGDK